MSYFLSQTKNKSEQSELCSDVERVMGVEPTYQPWEGRILPMNYTRIVPTV